MSLRKSQVEVLRQVEAVNDKGRGAPALSVAFVLRRGEHSAERSLIRLAELGYLSRSSSPPALYSLTQAGKQALEDGK